jgi:hypothetical protein
MPWSSRSSVRLRWPCGRSGPRGLAWIEAFDQIKLTEILHTMRGLDLFSEQSLPAYFADVLHNKLLKIFGSVMAAAKPAAESEPKQPRSLTTLLPEHLFSHNHDTLQSASKHIDDGLWGKLIVIGIECNTGECADRPQSILCIHRMLPKNTAGLEIRCPGGCLPGGPLKLPVTAG